MSVPRRGEVYWVDLNPTVGTEMAKRRPAVIISNDVGNQYSGHVIVTPLTSQGADHVYPFEVLVPSGESGLDRSSKIALDQIRTVDKVRLRQKVGVLSAERLEQVDAAIRLSLNV